MRPVPQSVLDATLDDKDDLNNATEAEQQASLARDAVCDAFAKGHLDERTAVALGELAADAPETVLSACRAARLRPLTVAAQGAPS